MGKKNGSLFGGLFDFNGDGKTDLGEEFLALKIFENCIKDNDDTRFSEENDVYANPIPSKNYSWRAYCEDGAEFGLFPEDFESEEEYMEALEVAKNAWRDACDVGAEFGLYPEDFETEEEYADALEVAKNAWLE